MIRTPLVVIGFQKQVEAGLFPNPKEAEAFFESIHPIGRLGYPLDVAQAVLYLASNASGFVTGSELVIDGGYTAQ